MTGADVIISVQYTSRRIRSNEVNFQWMSDVRSIKAQVFYYAKAESHDISESMYNEQNTMAQFVSWLKQIISH